VAVNLSQNTHRISNQSRPTIPLRAGNSRLDVDRGERESLKNLGKYLHTTPQGLAIIKLQNTAAIGTPVVDEKGRPVGNVADVFGPIASPYCSVKLVAGNSSPLKVEGGELYIAEGKRSPKRGKYGRP
jgi:rRNA processing protein Gar1